MGKFSIMKELFNLKKYILLIVISMGILSCRSEIVEKVILENGRVDLTSLKYQNVHNHELGGGANFYWNEFLSISEINSGTNESTFINTLKSWDNQSENISYPTMGYGTYHFQIKIPEQDIGKQFIIRPNHFIAYASEIYVGDELISYNGKVGKSIEDSAYLPFRSTHSRPFVAESNIIEVVIWVANFNHFRAGIFNNILFGYAENMIEHREKAIAYDLIVIVSLLIMFFYHFILYFVNSRETTSLFFSFTCLIFAFDFSLQDTMSFFLIFPNASYNFSSILHLSLPYLLPSSFIYFLHALFPREMPKTVRNIVGAITVILVSLTIINIPLVNSYIVKPHFIYNILIVFYTYYVVIRALINKREGAGLFLFAYFIFSVCAINDILFVLEIIYTASLVSTGLIVFVFLLSILQGRRMANMHRRNITLANKLQELNVGLEQKVFERTEELNETNSQLKQLISFKEDLTNTIIHDLKTPLNAIINARLIKDENSRLGLIQQSGYNMMNLIKNILDVYRYDKANLELDKRKADLFEIISDSCEEIRFNIDQKSLKIEFSQERSYILNVDVEVIRRVFVNILSNAIKYSPNNSTIKIRTKQKDENTIIISIINEGKEISRDQQELIFEKFGQGDKPKHSKTHSSGLGLSFCKLAIEAHGGEIGVISELNEKVEFWFTLPDSIQSFKTTKKIDTEKAEITTADKDYLQHFITELKAKNIYEISAISAILKSIEPKSQTVVSWKSEVEKAVYSGDNSVFESLLNI